MPLLLLVAFIAVPLLELWVIGAVADVLTLGPTLLLLLLDSVLGAWLVRREGSRAWRSFQEAVGQGRVPGDELAGGVLLLFGGALLLTPGFITDAVGLALVVPVTRRPLAALLRRRAVAGALASVRVGPGAWTGGAGSGTPGGGRSGPDGGASGGQGVEVLSVERDEPPSLDGGDGRG